MPPRTRTPDPGMVYFICTCGRAHQHEATHGVGPGSRDKPIEAGTWEAGDRVKLRNQGNMAGEIITKTPTRSKMDGRLRVLVQFDGTDVATWHYVDDLVPAGNS
jgi:hypothetical protein